MNERKIQKLIELVEKSNINELEFSKWGTKVRIIKNPASPASLSVAPSAPAPTPIVEIQPPPAPVPVAAPPAPEPKEPVSSVQLIEIKAPMVGTFYQAPAPEADIYVKIGDVIAPGQVLCIIEAMKLMNEIEAECSGKIVKIVAENAKPVEYNQVLFEIEPAE